MARKGADMTQGEIWRHFVSFSVPLAIGLLFQQMYNTVDSVVVGQYVGKEALAAVGSTSSIINMLIGLFNGLSVGAGVVISQSYGAKDMARLRRAVHTTVALTFILCVVATAAGLAIVWPMLRMMQTPGDVIGESAKYLTIYFAGISGLLIYNMGSAILRAVGDSRRPLYFLVFSALTNTVLDLVFVVVFKMGVAGVSLATIIAQGVSAVLVLITLTRVKEDYGIRWSQLKISREEMKQVFGIGAPSAVQQALTAFSNVFVQSYINAFGAAGMAGWSGYNKLDAFLTVPVMAIAQASTTFVGQNWGARKPERARKGVNLAILLALGSTAILTVLLMVFARPLMRLFSGEPDVIDYGVRFVHIITPFYVTICFNQIFGGALRGIGNARTPMLIMLGSFVVFRQAYLYVTSSMGLGFVAVALAYPMGWVVCSSCLAVTYLRSPLYHANRRLNKRAAA